MADEGTIEIGDTTLDIDNLQIVEVLTGDAAGKTFYTQRRMSGATPIPVVTLGGVAKTVTVQEFDVGSKAIDRPLSYPDGKTLIVKENPAQFTGKITGIEIWSHIAMSEVTVATFTQGIANVFTARDSEIVGNVAGGSKVHKVVDLDVVAGDFIGLYWGGGYIERTNSGDGFWSLTGDQTGCTDETFALYTGHTISLRATREITAGNVFAKANDNGRAMFLFGDIPPAVNNNIIIEYEPKYYVRIPADGFIYTGRIASIANFLLICKEV